jgi:hypothetical protein
MASMGKTRGSYRVLVGKPEGKNHVEYLDADMKYDLQDVECGGMDLSDLAPDRNN